jgi:hypothetical protein
MIRANDLPPTWDGVPVTWDGWTDTRWTTWIFHSKPEACEKCGSVAPQQSNMGVVARGDGARQHQVARFFAYRCPGCQLDTVIDIRTDTAWTLDETDYGQDGSEVTQKELF